MSPNFLTKIAAGPVLTVVVALLVARYSRDEEPSSGTAPAVGGEALGIERDTPRQPCPRT